MWLVIIIILLLVAGGLYVYKTSSTNTVPVELAQQTPQQSSSSNTPSIPTVSSSTLKDYVFSSVVPNDLVVVKLSHQAIGIESSWGLEQSYKGSPDGSLGQYTFANGVKMTLTVDKLSPQDELKQSDLSASDQEQYTSVFQFIASKIGPNFSSYDYEKFLHETSQQTVDQATTQGDKLGYSEVLVLKNVTSFSPSDTIFQFINQNGKGFIWMPPNATIPSAVDFWGSNGWRYTFMFPAKQNISEGEVDTVIQSIKTL